MDAAAAADSEPPAGVGGRSDPPVPREAVADASASAAAGPPAEPSDPAATEQPVSGRTADAGGAATADGPASGAASAATPEPAAAPASAADAASVPAPSLPGKDVTNPSQLVLTAVVPPKQPVTAPDPLSAVRAKAPVLFTVRSNVDIAEPTLKAGAVKIPATFRMKNGSAKEWSGNVSFASQPADDIYATVGDGTDEVRSPAMPITVISAAAQTPAATGGGGGSGNNAEAPAEVAVGEYDADFARRTGAVFRGLAFLFAGLAAWMLLWILPMGGVAADDVDITERVVAAASTIALAVGVIAILAGVWMALLEARGRQRAKLSLAEGGTRGAGGIGMSIADVERLAKALSKVRGTIAAFVIGVMLVVLGLTALTVQQAVSDPPATTQTGEPEEPAGEEGDR